jgi:hypothetical protein
VMILQGYMRREALQAGETDSTSTQNSMIQLLVLVCNGLMLVWPAFQMIDTKTITSIMRACAEKFTLLINSEGQGPRIKEVDYASHLGSGSALGLCHDSFTGVETLNLGSVISDMVILDQSLDDMSQADPATRTPSQAQYTGMEEHELDSQDLEVHCLTDKIYVEETVDADPAGGVHF